MSSYIDFFCIVGDEEFSLSFASLDDLLVGILDFGDFPSFKLFLFIPTSLGEKLLAIELTFLVKEYDFLVLDIPMVASNFKLVVVVLNSSSCNSF